MKPGIRFGEFTDAWEQRKLGELTDVYDGTHQTPNYTDKGIMFLSVENIKTLRSEKYISEEDFKKDFKVFPEKGDILMTRIGDIGTANVVESNEPKAYYVSLALLKYKELNPYFLKESIASETVKNELWHRTLHIAFPKKINKNEIGNISILYPKSKEEQTKIGEFFKSLDNLITLQQRKPDKIKKLKSAYLSKMFPKEGEKYPRLRFAGFTDAWEQRKLGEIADKAVDNRGKTPPLDSNGTHPLIEVASLGTGSPDYSKVEKFLNDYSFEHNLRDYIKKGDILFSTVGSIGLVSLMDDRENAAIAQNIVAFRAKENYSPEYLYALFSTESSKIKAYRIVMGAVQPSIKVSQLVDVKYFVTNNKEEQKLIGDFFIKLDNLITLHQRELEKLKQLKQAMLQKMFV